MQLQKKYGLFTAISMVIGIVIGSGVFFKSQSILQLTNGNVLMGVIAFAIGGLVMMVCALTISSLATKYGTINGLLDYSEEMVGKKYSFLVGWFLSFLYYPSVTGVLAWVTSHYASVAFGYENSRLAVILVGLALIAIVFTVNLLAPKIAGKLQVSTTIIKLIPLIVMSVVGVIYGLCRVVVEYQVIEGVVKEISTGPWRILVNNFQYNTTWNNKDLFKAVIAVSFAFDGWIVATSIVGELKNEKRNLPLALFFGSNVVVLIYILYYLGLTGGASVPVLQVGGVEYAYYQIFGKSIGNIFNIFIVISCFGTFNGMVLATMRCFYAVSHKNERLENSKLRNLNRFNTPTLASALGVVLIFGWFVYFCFFNYKREALGFFAFDNSELPIILNFACYIPIFIMMIVKERKEFGIFRGIILPVLGVLACIFMIGVTVYAYRNEILAYLIILGVIILFGSLFLIQKKPKKEEMVLNE